MLEERLIKSNSECLNDLVTNHKLYVKERITHTTGETLTNRKRKIILKQIRRMTNVQDDCKISHVGVMKLLQRIKERR